MKVEPVPEAALDAAWQAHLEPAVCEICDWRFLLPAGSPVQRCPHCFQADLALLDAKTDLAPFPHPPELLLPFTVAAGQVTEAIERFGKGIPFAPRDLAATSLLRRLRRVYLPMWLVDAQVQAQFQAEAGYDYEVVSHQERYTSDRWQTHEVKETRIRWEARLGRLQRAYQNIPAPALEEEKILLDRLGGYELGEAEEYQPLALSQSFVHLPDRLPADAWAEAEGAFRGAAIRESMQAAEAQHIRDFQWSAQFEDKHWTQLLRPLYTTYYLDDEEKPRTVWVHGRTGQLYGQRRASMRRAQRVALFIGIAGAAFFLLALIMGLIGLALPALFVVAVVMAAVGFVLVAGALVPPLIAWNFNRQARAHP